MRARSLTALGIVAAALSGMPAAQPAPYLLGRVIDADTGEPVAGAAIHLSGRRAITLQSGADGRYQSATLPPGMYTLTVTRDGYLPAVSLYADRVPLRLRVRDDGIGPATVRKDWMLERAARIRGRVLTQGGDPIGGVTVMAAKRVRNVDGWPELESKGSAVSGAGGGFEIGNLARGAYVLAWQLPVGGAPRWFYSPGIVDPRHATRVEAVTGRVPQTIELRGSSVASPSVTVTTRSESGLPAPAVVELTAWSPFPDMAGATTLATVTDRSGRGSLAGVPVGRHRLRARAPSSLGAAATARAEATLEIPADISSGADLRLEPAVSACVFTRTEPDGATADDLRSPPIIRAGTRDGALDGERLEAQATLGETIRLEGLMPRSQLTIEPLAQRPLWALTRFSPARAAPRGVLPIDAAVAGCTAAYFRRTTESIRGRVALGDSEWIPDVELIATPVNASSAPIAVSAMTDDGVFQIRGIALGILYDVMAVPSGISPDEMGSGLRHVIRATGGDVISIPLTLPIAR